MCMIFICLLLDLVHISSSFFLENGCFILIKLIKKDFHAIFQIQYLPLERHIESLILLVLQVAPLRDLSKLFVREL